MATPYQMNFSECFPFSDTGVKAILAASTALPFTVPGTENQIYRASFGCSSNAEIWVNNNGTATVPTSNTASATVNQEFVIPGMCRYVKGGDVLSFISTGTPQIGVSLLKVQDIS
jgi:hypothetical protein